MAIYVVVKTGFALFAVGFPEAPRVRAAA